MFTYNIPDATSIDVVADWVELYVTFTKESISKTELISYLQASAGGDEDDNFIVSVWNTLRERSTLYGNSPPIEVLPRIVNSLINWEDYPEYLTCLIYSLEGNPNTVSASAAHAGKYFERISNEAIRNFLNGKSMIYGFPTNQNIESVVNNQMLERFIYHPPSNRNDRDLDIIAWKNWGDSRASQIVLLVQCAAGGNWKTKLKDLNLLAWQKYIHFSAAPIKGFSVPVIISDRDKLHEFSTDAGVIIDRPRIYKGTYNYPFLDVELRPILINWCRSRISEITN